MSKNNACTKPVLNQIPLTKPYLTESEKKSVISVLESGWLTTGPKVKDFEKAIKDYLGAEYVIALSSCTAALHLSLLAYNIGPGDEVITTPLTFAATINSIIHVGATPVLADIDPLTCNINLEEVEKKITKKTRAILAVHFAGLPCDVDKLKELGKKHGIAIIEDAAHAIGSRYKTNMIGGNSEAACFSFHPAKTITTIEGGALVTNSEELNNKARRLSFHGIDRSAWARAGNKSLPIYDVKEAGFKYNMSDIQAAVGICQLDKVEEIIEKKRRLVGCYQKYFKNISSIQLFCEEEDSRHSYHLLIAQLLKGDRSEFLKRLSARGISTNIHYTPIPSLSFYRNRFGWNLKDFPGLEQLSEAIFSLPLYPQMHEEEVKIVAEAIREIEDSL